MILLVLAMVAMYSDTDIALSKEIHYIVPESMITSHYPTICLLECTQSGRSTVLHVYNTCNTVFC